jgi:ABC-type sugar transport system ATPase subunit
MTISLHRLEKRYPDGTHAVRGIDLEVGDGEFVTLLGPSGCGKTTTLRLIAGLEEPTAGVIRIGGRDVTKIDPGDRDIAMVFQSYALYPHMTVAENMTLNLTVRGMKKDAAYARARETARMLGIEELMDKKPARLSGGQRQRVALGRAMVRSPVAFLMDEPLSNLDLKLREQMRTELKTLHGRLKVTTVYVTHDQTEALILSDRVVVMNSGFIEQAADPITIYERPANRFVAEFIGSPGINVVAGECTDLGCLVAGRRVAASPAGIRGAVHVGVRPENVVLGAPGGAGLGGKIAFSEPYGSTAYAFVEVPAVESLLQTRKHVVASVEMHRPLRTGEGVALSFRDDRLTLFDPESGKALHHMTAIASGAYPERIAAE